MLRGDEKQKQQTSIRFRKILIAFLYFVQGIYLNVPGTMTLTYKNMPSYEILGYFSIILIPFSMKFISGTYSGY